MTAQRHFQVALRVDTLKQPQRDEETLSRLVSALRQPGADYLPDSFWLSLVDESFNLLVSELKPFTLDAIGDIFPLLQTKLPGTAHFAKGNPAILELWIPLGVGPGRERIRGDKNPPRHDGIPLFVNRSLVDTHPRRLQFRAVGEALFEACNGFFAELGTTRLTARRRTDLGDELVLGDIEEGLPPPRWGFMLGKGYVELLGLERVRQAPCEVVEEFGDRSFLLLLAEDMETLEDNLGLFEERRRRLVEHFGPEHFAHMETAQPKRVLAPFGQRRQ